MDRWSQPASAGPAARRRRLPRRDERQSGWVGGVPADGSRSPLPVASPRWKPAGDSSAAAETACGGGRASGRRGGGGRRAVAWRRPGGGKNLTAAASGVYRHKCCAKRAPWADSSSFALLAAFAQANAAPKFPRRARHHPWQGSLAGVSAGLDASVGAPRLGECEGTAGAAAHRVRRPSDRKRSAGRPARRCADRAGWRATPSASRGGKRYLLDVATLTKRAYS